ncbi:MAG TPA: coproporphyrinogen III oxidase family protein, partial [Alphaproteobacteria bacterium]|nr:coproporphyrinogen III oxidase family protein [Alphaproteobacteria bacterium]
PGQTDDAWLRTIAEAASSNASHLSCYALTVHADTPFGRRRAAGEPTAAGDDRQRELFLLADRFLSERGWLHYEISNFARGPGDRSRHNTRYWDGTPYLGLGPAAHSLLGRRRWWNAAALGDWLAAVEAGDDPAAGGELLNDDDLLLEELMLGLRTAGGVPVALLTGLPAGRETLRELVDAGLLVIRGGRAAPTPEGMLVADALPLRFAGGG